MCGTVDWGQVEQSLHTGGTVPPGCRVKSSPPRVCGSQGVGTGREEEVEHGQVVAVGSPDTEQSKYNVITTLLSHAWHGVFHHPSHPQPKSFRPLPGNLGGKLF